MDTGFSKKEKKIAHELIAKGLQADLRSGLKSFDTILQEYKDDGGDIRDHYNNFFKTVKEFDRFTIRRYEGMRNSDLLNTLASQLIEGLLQEAELAAFSPETRNEILRDMNFMKNAGN